MGCVTLVTPPRTASLTCLVSINCTTQAVADHLQVMAFHCTFEQPKSLLWKTLVGDGEHSGGGKRI